jgi:chromosome segregation ATPase
MFSSKRERSGAELLPSSDEALAERVDMLASTVSSAAAALARTDGEIAGLRKELGNGLARLEELTAELRSRARASDLRELEKKLGSIDVAGARGSDPKRIEDLASKIAGLAERVDTLGTTVASAAASGAGRDGEVASLRRMLDQRAPAQAVDERLVRRVENAVATSASVSLRIESQAAETNALAGRIEALEERLPVLEERVDTGESDRVALVGSVVETTAARWLELDRGLRDLAERLDAAEKQASAVAAELSRATSLWPTALRSLESRVDELAGAPRRNPDAPVQPAADTHLLAAIQTLEQRMRSADVAAHEERELLLDRLDYLAGRLGERLEPLHHQADIVPFRSDP